MNYSSFSWPINYLPATHPLVSNQFCVYCLITGFFSVSIRCRSQRGFSISECPWHGVEPENIWLLSHASRSTYLLVRIFGWVFTSSAHLVLVTITNVHIRFLTPRFIICKSFQRYFRYICYAWFIGSLSCSISAAGFPFVILEYVY